MPGWLKAQESCINSKEDGGYAAITSQNIFLQVAIHTCMASPKPGILMYATSLFTFAWCLLFIRYALIWMAISYGFHIARRSWTKDLKVKRFNSKLRDSIQTSCCLVIGMPCIVLCILHYVCLLTTTHMYHKTGNFLSATYFCWPTQSWNLKTQWPLKFKCPKIF